MINMAYRECIERAEPLSGTVTEQLEDIKDAIKLLTHKALDLLPRNNTLFERAHAYWFSDIIGALDDDSTFGGSTIKIQDTIEALQEYNYDDYRITSEKLCKDHH